MQNIDDYIKKSVEYTVEKMGGYPGDAVRVYRNLINLKGFEKHIRKRKIDNSKTVRKNPVRSLNRINLTADERKIFDIIYAQTEVSYEDLEAVGRKRTVVDVRKKAMVIFAIYLDYTLDKTGLLFGGRDHSTVIHAINTHDDLLQSNGSYAIGFKKLLDEVKEQLPHYFNTKPVSLSDLRKEFDQAKWERFATRWVKEKKDMNQLKEIKEALVKYEQAKAN
jgi:hypothetical protein